jgi:hypothetical protein
VHPAYSPDTAPSDVSPFDGLKGEMADFIANSPTDTLSEIGRIFQEISRETLVAAYDEWITRLKWVIEHKGEYYYTE